ncbi:iron-containing alcohol dehydrogenase [Lacrimispora xylanolytica]|uniref:Iron-containing alcohol dehydrogenase n=1 Tax=Lacrimispora xylanolytica TaxID=29375 RepID=A0ABY7AF81_9FIRM|nr:iron-containing alcohol dehydrogenase [Lacrimispora xylanolytica]WAJ24438.1 iron-containing alcohol dehydrogenase [Lacrimispora xylanolytica]
MEFQYYLPVNLVFGRGKADVIGERAAALGTRALIVTGGSSTRKSGLLDRAIKQLENHGVSYVLFDKAEPNPLTTTVWKGAETARREGCDFILSIGGGSSLDTGKGIAFLAVNEGDISDYIYGKKKSDKALPVLAVPTTCGTGSEGNGFAVMTNPDTLDKKSLRCSAIVPACSIVDPQLMMTMPGNILASVGFDALCHNIDAYLSATSQPLTELMALEGVRLAAESLVSLYEGSKDLNHWDQLSLASTLGGMVINTAGVTALHGMEHPVSGLKDAVHGRGLAALAPYVFEASIKGAPHKFSALSRLLGGKGEWDFTDQIRSLITRLGLTEGLKDMGVEESDLNWLTENCFKVSAPSMANHPVVFTPEEVKEIYRKSL